MEGGARDARQPSVATQEKENKERAPGRQQPHNQTATAPSTILKTRATITMRGVRLASALPPHANGEVGSRVATEGPQTVITSHFGHPHTAHLRLPFAAGLAAISWRNTGPLPSRRKKILRWSSSTTSGWSHRCCAGRIEMRISTPCFLNITIIMTVAGTLAPASDGFLG